MVIDGTIGYVGGINVSNKYDNTKKNSVFWRDTHIRIEGNAVNKVMDEPIINNPIALNPAL